MGFFKSLFGNRIVNENKTKPFHQNKTAKERIDWFSRTSPWDSINPVIIGALVEKFGEDPMFEVFVLASMELKLISRYKEIPAQDLVDNRLICWVVSKILCTSGNECLRIILPWLQDPKGSIDKVDRFYRLALDSFETSIILDNLQISAYLGMATIHAFVNKKELALKEALKGLEQIRRFKEKGLDVAMGENNPEIGEAFRNAELGLNSIVAKYS